MHPPCKSPRPYVLFAICCALLLLASLINSCTIQAPDLSLPDGGLVVPASYGGALPPSEKPGADCAVNALLECAETCKQVFECLDRVRAEAEEVVLCLDNCRTWCEMHLCENLVIPHH